MEMTDWRRRRALSKSLAIVCVVVVAGAGVAVYFLGSGPFGQQTVQIGASGPSGIVVLYGILSVQNRSGEGTLTLQARNPSGGISSVTSMTFASDPATPLSNVGALVMEYQGKPLSPSNPLAGGSAACGSVAVGNVTAGDAYTVEMNATLQDGSHEHEGLSITAQLGSGGCAAVSSSQTSAQTTSCSAAEPLSLTQIGPVVYSNFGNTTSYPSLNISWWNCSDKLLQFAMTASPLTVTVESNGATSRVTATLDTAFQNYTRTIGADAGLGFELPIMFDPPLSPGTTILHVNGTLTAIDPATESPLSAQTAFGT